MKKNNLKFHKKYFRLPRKIKKERKKINKALIARYPFLYPINIWTGKKIENFDYTYNEFEYSLPSGWWKRFGIALCEDLKECLEEANALDDFYITQVKEKYGSIRIYSNFETEKWSEHLWAWEEISSHTCAVCGEFPVPLRDDGYVLPKCDTCFMRYINKNNNIENKEEYIKEVTEEDWDGRMPETKFIRQYSKDGYTTIEIDMKPFYDKIGWKYTKENLISREELLKKIEESKKSENVD